MTPARYARRAVPCLLALMVIAAPVPADDGGRRKDFPGIEKLMSAEEFSDAGLGKLSPNELLALNAWLLRYTAGEAYVVQTTSAEVHDAVADFRMEARILPPFTGWTGTTVFRLDNGQLWRQRIKGRYVHSGDDTAVVITRNFLGYYVMTLTASGRSIGVEPVRHKPGAGPSD